MVWHSCGMATIIITINTMVIAFLQACNAVHMSTARFRFQVALEARAISRVLLSRSGFWRARGCGCASAWVLALDTKKKKECESAFFLAAPHVLTALATEVVTPTW
jgi:hypothetical protein